MVRYHDDAQVLQRHGLPTFTAADCSQRRTDQETRTGTNAAQDHYALSGRYFSSATEAKKCTSGPTDEQPEAGTLGHIRLPAAYFQAGH